MSKPIIQLNDISASYGKRLALEKVNLTVFDDDYLGVIGPNGGGKTTLMKIILRLKKATKGTIQYFRDGKPVEELTMGYLPQYNKIDHRFPISVYEVVLSGLNRQKRLFRPYTKQQHQQVEATMQRLQLENLRNRPIGELSGGQLQRVLLARAIVSKPDVIILDEPNTYIDKRFQEQMYEILNEIHRDCAIIIVSHDVAEILQNVKHIACVNQHVHYHETAHLDSEKLEEHFLHIL